MVAHPTDKKLTAKEEAFARLVASGDTAADAWRKAYGKPGVKYANRNSYVVMKRPRVAHRIAELRKPDEKRLFLTRARKRELLHDWAENSRLGLLDRQRALDLDNKMDGSYQQVVRVEGEVTLALVMKALAGAPILPTSDEVFELTGVGNDLSSRRDDTSALSAETPAGLAAHTFPAGINAPNPSDRPPGGLPPVKTAPGGPMHEDSLAFITALMTEKAPVHRNGNGKVRTRTYEE